MQNMGTRLAREQSFTIFAKEKDAEDMKASPSYKFNRFMQACEDIQHKKENIEKSLRQEIKNWKENVKNDEFPLAKRRQYMFSLLQAFRQLQDEQNKLLEKEKLRLDQLSPTESKKMRNRLKYFAVLNRQQKDLMSKVHENTKDCKTKSGSSYRTRQRTGSSADVYS